MKNLCVCYSWMYLIAFCCSVLGGCADIGIVGKGIPIPLPGTFYYKVNSLPPGAEIYFNGVYKGKAPIEWERTLLLQTIGTHRIEARLAGHETGYVEGNIYTRKHTSRNASAVLGDRSSITFRLPMRIEGGRSTEPRKLKKPSLSPVLGTGYFLD